MGRASEWHSGGRRFDPVQLHQNVALARSGSLFRTGERFAGLRAICSLMAVVRRGQVGLLIPSR
jgi:hypothetical protein